MAFTLDPQTGKITFGVVADLTHDAIARDIASEFGVSETFKDDFVFANQGLADIAWVPQDTPANQVNITNSNYDFTIKRDGTNTGTTLDLGAGNVSDTSWVLRAKVSIGSPLTFTSVLSASCNIGISDNASSTLLGSLNNDISIALTDSANAGGQAEHVAFDRFNGTVTSITGGVGASGAFSAGETIFIEIVRLSATSMRTRIYTDSSYSVVRNSITKTISAGLTGGRFIHFNQATDVTGYNGVFTGTIDDIQFWNGITVPVITSSNWRMRFELDITGLTTPSGADVSLWISLSDKDVTSDSNTVNDAFALAVFVDNIQNFFRIQTSDNQSPRTSGSDATPATVPTVNTFFIEMRRDSLSQTTVIFYTDNTFTTISETLTQAGISGTDNLKYLKLFNDVLANNANEINGTFDNFTFTDLTFVGAPTDKVFTVDAILEQQLFTCGDRITFQDDFATAVNWVQTGTQVTIAGGEIQGWGADATTQRLTHDLVTPLSDKSWTAEFEFEFSAFANPAHDIFVITDTNSNSGALQDHIACRFGFSGGLIQFGLLHGGNNQIGSGTILGVTASINTRYFVRLQRITSGIARLTVFTGGFDSVLFGTIDVDLTLFGGTPTGLQFIISETSVLGGGARNLTGIIDNLVLTNACCNFEVDSFLQVTNSETFSVDAIIKLTGDVLCGVGGPQTIFTEDFTTNAGWTYTGSFPSKLFVDGVSFPDVLRLQCFRSTAVDGSQQIVKDMGVTFNQGNFQSGDIIWEFDFLHVTPCAGFASSQTHFSLTENSSNVGDNRNTISHITFRTNAEAPFLSGSPMSVLADYGDGSGTIISTTTIVLVNDTQYFPRITKSLDGTLKLEMFTDSGRTTQETGSPVSIDASAVANMELKFIQVASFGGGGNGRRQRASIDNVSVTQSAGCPRFQVDAFLQSQGTCNETTALFDQIAGNSGLWTSNTSQIVIDSGGSGIVEMNALVGGGTTTSRRAFRALQSSFPANIGKITMRQKVTHVSGTIETGIFMAIQEGTGDASLALPQPRMLLAFGSGSPPGLFAQVQDGAGGIVSTPQPQIVIADGVTQFVEVIYDPVVQTLTLNSFSDAGFSVPVAGSPLVVDTSIINMPSTLIDTVVSSNFTNSGAGRVISADLDDYTVITGGCPSFTIDARLRLPKTFDFIVDGLIQALGINGNCPFPATETFYSRAKSPALAERLGEGVNSPFAGISRAGVKIVGATHAGKGVEDMRVLGIRRNGVGATGTMFATIRDENDIVIAISTNSVLAESLPTTGAGNDVTFTFDNKVVLQDGFRILLEFPNCIGCADSSNEPNVFWFGTSTASPAGTERTFFSKTISGEGYFETTVGFTQGGVISFTTSPADPAKQQGCADVDAFLLKTQTKTFLVDGFIFILPVVNTFVDGILQAFNINKDFTIDGCLRIETREEFEIDACLQVEDRDELFTVDALIFILPVRLFLIDAIVRYAQGTITSPTGGIPDLIIRVLRENPPSLTGREIVSEIVKITSDPAEGFSFRGKTSRIKNWLNRLRLDNLIQEDGSNPDWYRTNWSLV